MTIETSILSGQLVVGVHCSRIRCVANENGGFAMSRDVANQQAIRFGIGTLRPPVAPYARPVLPSEIPSELLELRQWVAWDWAQYLSSWRKVPISALTSHYCNDANLQFACDFHQAYGYSRRRGLPGVGLVLAETDGLVALDIDDCVDPKSGAVDPSIWRKVKKIDTYTEYSPTNSGLRLLIKDSSQTNRGTDDIGPVEVFMSDCFVTITGRRVPDASVQIADFPVSRVKEIFDDGDIPATHRSGWFHEAPDPPIHVLAAHKEAVMVSLNGSLELWPLPLDGNTVWRRPSQSNVLQAAIGDGIVLVGTDDEHCLALDQWTGKQRWELARVGIIEEFDLRLNSPLLVSCRYEYPKIDQSAPDIQYGWKLVDQRTGEVIVQERGYIVVGMGRSGKMMHTSSPAIDDQFVVVCDTAHGSIVEIHDRHTGRVNWSTLLGENAERYSVELAEPYCAISVYGGSELLLIDTRTGLTRQLQKQREASVWCSIHGESVIGYGNDNSLVSTSIVTGHLNWHRMLPEGYWVDGLTAGSLVLSKRYKVSDPSVLVLDADTGAVVIECRGELVSYSGSHLWLFTPDQSIAVLDLGVPGPPRYVALPTDVAVYPPALVDDWDIYEDTVRVLALENNFLLTNGMMVSQFAM